jgi:hypothetical protein
LKERRLIGESRSKLENQPIENCTLGEKYVEEKNIVRRFTVCSYPDSLRPQTGR